MRINLLLASLAILPMTGGVAAAQSMSAPATYGSRTLSSGFTPDPYTVNVTAGGSIQASSASSGCSGTIANAPDFELSYTAGNLPLIFRTASSADTTLVINGPNGSWYCDDDGGDGVNAEVRFNNPTSGTYDVWVGSYSGGMEQATLQITELGGGGSSAPAGGGDRPDPTVTATYGSVRLSGNFTPDPYTVGVVAGGSIEASSVGSGCTGTVARAPDFELTYTPGSLPLIFRTASSGDTTLVVNAPNGSWYCDDDSGAEGLNAEVRFNSPQSGVYDVWVGHLSGDTQTTLQVSELGGGGYTPTPDSGATSTLSPDASLTAAYGEVTLRSGFTPDPRRISLRAGGPVPAANASPGCTGSIARAPDYQITYTAGRLPLIIRTESATDTTLVVNDPDGVWHCDDDGRGRGGDAQVNLDKPASGVYDIWVGTFGGGTAAATLVLTERP